MAPVSIHPVAAGSTRAPARRHALIAATLCAVATTACGANGEQLPTYRYRLTVEVPTPEGTRSGSSVIEVRTRRYGKEALPQMRGDRKEVEGEAVAVDLGKRGTLFALLRTRYSEVWPAEALYSVLPADSFGDAERLNAVLALKGRHELPKVLRDGTRVVENHPVLVRFGDTNRPESAMVLAETDLAKTFGAGVFLSRITVERTDAPVTRTIRTRLPWLASEPTDTVDKTFSASPSASVRF